MFYQTTDPGGAVLVDLTNESSLPIDCSYACLTAPGIVRCEVVVDGKIHDVVFAGGGSSHSWWTTACGKLLPRQGLLPGLHLRITVSGPAALRIDWDE